MVHRTDEAGLRPPDPQRLRQKLAAPPGIGQLLAWHVDPTPYGLIVYLIRRG